MSPPGAPDLTVEFVTRQLCTPLPPHEKLDEAEKLAMLLKNLADLDATRKDTLEQLGERRKSLEELARVSGELIRVGREADVSCKVVKDYRACTVTVIRTDRPEHAEESVVEVRAMTPEELQRELALGVTVTPEDAA